MIKRIVSCKNDEEFTVHCDSCRAPTPQQKHATAGEAADHARLAGFTTKFAYLTAPCTWHCPKCSPPTANGIA